MWDNRVKEGRDQIRPIRPAGSSMSEKPITMGRTFSADFICRSTGRPALPLTIWKEMIVSWKKYRHRRGGEGRQEFRGKGGKAKARARGREFNVYYSTLFGNWVKSP